MDNVRVTLDMNSRTLEVVGPEAFASTIVEAFLTQMKEGTRFPSGTSLADGTDPETGVAAGKTPDEMPRD